MIPAFQKDVLQNVRADFLQADPTSKRGFMDAVRKTILGSHRTQSRPPLTEKKSSDSIASIQAEPGEREYRFAAALFAYGCSSDLWPGIRFRFFCFLLRQKNEKNVSYRFLLIVMLWPACWWISISKDPASVAVWKDVSLDLETFVQSRGLQTTARGPNPACKSFSQ